MNLARRLHPQVAVAALGLACAVASAGAVSVIGKFGALSPPGLATVLAMVAAGGLAVFYLAPQALIVLTPMFLPLPYLAHVFPYEMALLVLTGVIAIVGWRRRADWLFRLGPLEIAVLASMAWAFSTALWCTDWDHYLLGVRRLTMGFVTLWAAWRFARLAPRRWFELGLLLGTITLSLAAIVAYLSTGFTAERALIERASATDLGWGKANFIATILLLVSPVLLHIGLHGDRAWNRALAWVALPLVGGMQVLIASRAALVLFMGGLLVQVLGRRAHHRLLLLVLAGFAAIFLGPWATGVLIRFTNVRELGSIAIRGWYFREAWRRTESGFPLGIGLGQGWGYPDHLNVNDPHNYWLVLSSELGVLGELTWIVVLVVLWRGIRRLEADPSRQLPGWPLQIAFWLAQLHTLVEPTFQGIQYPFVFFWLMGGYLGYGAAGAPPERRRE
ncbi:MAG TPA: hypothetical protein VI792_05110 [Candidatus Eisenbacteria bacterium]